MSDNTTKQVSQPKLYEWQLCIVGEAVIYKYTFTLDDEWTAEQRSGSHNHSTDFLKKNQQKRMLLCIHSYRSGATAFLLHVSLSLFLSLSLSLIYIYI